MRDYPAVSPLLPVVSTTAIEHLKTEGIDVIAIGKHLFGSSWKSIDMTHEQWQQIIRAVEEESVEEDA